MQSDDKQRRVLTILSDDFYCIAEDLPAGQLHPAPGTVKLLNMNRTTPVEQRQHQETTARRSIPATPPKRTPVLCELGAHPFQIDADLLRAFRTRVKMTQRDESDVISWLLQLYVTLPGIPTRSRPGKRR